MCGITGFVTRQASAPRPEVLERMNAAIVHRGPDEDGAFIDDHCSLAMRRLSIIDLAGGKQPIWNADRTKCIVFNGEIYNYRELRSDLQKRGHKFYTNSDTEAIIHLYDDLGVECLQQLRGMFALAIWDTVDRSLFLARDRVGKKPLLYSHQVSGDLVFGSEFRAVLAHPSIEKVPDPAAIDRYLSFGYVPSPMTAFKAIRKLPAGHWLRWREGKVEIERYWNPDFCTKIKISEPEAIDETERLLSESVGLRLISEVPLGAFLSGGVDSSAVVALMARRSSSPVKTFSIGFEDEDFNELKFARLVAEHVGAEHHEFIVKPDALEVLPLLVRHYGEPFADSSAIPTYYVARETRRHVTVALNGDGGDEAFGGYERYAAMSIAERYRSVPRWIRAAVLDPMVSAIPQRAKRKAFIKNTETVLKAASLPRLDRYLRWVTTFSEADKAAIGFTGRESLNGNGSAIASQLSRDELHLIDQMLYADLLTYLPDDLLAKVDIASMANSLEARSPFLDHKFIEFAASLPVNLKVRGLQTKYLLKKVAARLVPREVVYRRKWGFGMPIGRWLRNDLRELVNDTLLSEKASKRGLFDQAAIEKIWSEHLSEERDNTWKLWNLLMLECWFREFIDQ